MPHIIRLPGCPGLTFITVPLFSNWPMSSYAQGIVKTLRMKLHKKDGFLAFLHSPSLD